jgi:hypothetical protein
MTDGFRLVDERLLPKPIPPTLKKQAEAALWRVIEGDNDAYQQHKDISKLLYALEFLPDSSTPSPPTHDLPNPNR